MGQTRPPARALCAALVALLAATGCVQAGPPSYGDRPDVRSSATVPQTTIQAADGQNLSGTEGDDDLRAGAGDDVVRGGGGDDRLYGGGGRDRLYGGPGDDIVDAQDPGSKGAAGRDEIFCGPGRDEVYMDAVDGEKPRGCEMAVVGGS